MANLFGGAPGRFATMTVTLNGTTASTSAEVGNGRLVGVIVPGTWTASTLTFEVSVDGASWGTLDNMSGIVTTPTLAANDRVSLDPTDFYPWPWVRVKSTTSQDAERVVTLVVVPIS